MSELKQKTVKGVVWSAVERATDLKKNRNTQNRKSDVIC
jgi:hypothetical protein